MNAAFNAMALSIALLPAIAFAGTHREWQFRVLLDKREIGSHVYTVDERGGVEDVTSSARFDVKLLLLDVYRYVHEAKERWQGNCLQKLDSRTDDNGNSLFVDGAREGSRFDVSATDGNTELGACVMSFAYWNPAILEQKKLLNAQTGKYVDVAVQNLGEEMIDVRGRPTATRHYALVAPQFRIEVWYSAGGRWVQLRSRTASGRELHYVLQ